MPPDQWVPYAKKMVIAVVVIAIFIELGRLLRSVLRLLRADIARWLDYIDASVIPQSHWPLALGIIAMVMGAILAADRTRYPGSLWAWLLNKSGSNEVSAWTLATHLVGLAAVLGIVSLVYR